MKPELSIEQAFGQHDFLKNVSRETFLKLEIYEKLLRKWQKTINLVGPATVAEAGVRHFLDSAQLIVHLPDFNGILADMGAGAGFPGMVLAIMGMKNVHLIESDARKAAFLQNVSRETSVPVTVHNCRIQDCKIPGVDIVTARALAPLEELLGHMSQLGPKSQGLFLKGAKYPQEIDAARKTWQFKCDIIPSLTDSTAAVLKIRDLACEPSTARS